jgi:two-component system, NtrC family, sensor histidine kinase HydH
MATAVPKQTGSRKRISGRVADIKSGEAMSIVTINAGDQSLVSTITNQAARELGLKVNDSVIALVKSTEAELHQKEKLASVGQLFAGLAHDLRNPLGVIRSSAQLVLDEQQPDNVKQEVTRYIIDEVDLLTHRINDFLRYAKQKPPEPKPISPERLVHSALGQWKAQGVYERITDITHFGQALPDLCVDPDQITEVLVNLLINAREAMPTGGRVTVAACREADGRIAVDVSDTGQGISPTNLSCIFEPFFTTKQYGTGLGLSNVKQLIEDNGGSIEVQSEPGKGSRFTLRFLSAQSAPAATKP